MEAQDPPRRHWIAGLGLLPLLQACSPLRLINATVPDDTHRLQADLAYGALPRQRSDVYLPGPAATGRPLVVFFYGGSWQNGSRKNYRFVGEALASRGIVTVVADYRLSPEVRYPAFLEDSALALRWALAQADGWNVDNRRVYLMGHSAGAYNAAMLALDPRWLAPHSLNPAGLAGWIGLAGPYDFLPIRAAGVRRVFGWPDTPADSQPLFHVRRPGPALPPHRVLLLAARQDRLVDPQRNTVGLAQALGQRGVAVESELLDGVGHATLIGALAPPLRDRAPVLERLTGFVAGSRA
ncbi:MAG TPA: alpha/beta hydrolase [Hydrogenophaga sp.]|uniref:alpha/beta hydrolase n=1 Tax=Hydrogenophaga sp. TaxID=1904254 RepID=UPI002CABF7C3|nr:alpha/beta hydrolase [Hydrogenophaga sp.]HMN93287.1 alpha/beta hydrolase [Hydrogenophaga sp.]HMP12087.1 alpha/beta hydrolase [Hydrogenophaga sp.]